MCRDNSPDENRLYCQSQDAERLFAQMSETLRRIAWALLRDWGLAEDAVQETFVLFSQRLSAIELGHAEGWLVRTVQFQAKNLRRGAAREQHYLQIHRNRQVQQNRQPHRTQDYGGPGQLDPASEVESYGPNPGSGNPGSGNPGSGNPGSGNPGAQNNGFGNPVDQAETVERLRVAIAALPDAQREVVTRRLETQQTFAEIAAATNQPLGTVLSRMRLALKRLTKEMNDND